LPARCDPHDHRIVLTKEERLRRKLERREKQRAANVGRAAKLHALRREAEATGDLAACSKHRSLPKINVGCSGWFYWDWRDRFYPVGSTTKEWFAHYADAFDTVELNAPFYSWPTPGTVQTWAKQAAGRKFVYTVKVSELITHVKRFARTAELVKDFCFIDRWLGARMGCFLFQLPPSFHYTPARLKRIVDQLNPTRRNVVEFRHRSWWNERVYAALAEKRIIFCSCSGPRLPDELIKTSDEIYIRFHGTTRWYRHDYKAEELAVWVNRIRAARPKRVWAYFNNDFGGHAIHNAREFLRQLSARSSGAGKRGAAR
jgi:uncharacterized protein YecE (DUF72 family)